MSSRESSPAIGTSNSPLPLSPNSKVKALLAQFDNESDEDVDSGSARARLQNALKSKAGNNAKNLQNLTNDDNGNGTVEESDDEEIVRPRGRMAARMQATVGESEKEIGTTADGKQSSTRRATKSASAEPNPNDAAAEDSDEISTPVRSRKRKIRTARRGTTPTSSPTSQPASPGLFVSPARPRSSTSQNDQSDDEDLPTNVATDNRFLALVAKKRQEREGKEAQEAAKQAEMRAERAKFSTLLEEDDEVSDNSVEKSYTQQERKPRKASKRAEEEIRRETQRLSRNEQLTHKAVTKKKFSKANFFNRFKSHPADVKDEKTPELSRPKSSSSAAPSSDVEMHDTPPTSPASHEEARGKSKEVSHMQGVEDQEALEDLPTLESILVQPVLEERVVDAMEAVASPAAIKTLDKGKGKAIHKPLADSESRLPKKKYAFTQRPVRIWQTKVDKRASSLGESDSDLEIISPNPQDAKMKKLDSLFDRVPAKQSKESHSLHALKMLAHLTSPGKQNLGRNKKPTITTTEMQLSLFQQARQQAAREREERLQSLRDKGVVIQTAEDREKELAEVEDLIAKARREGQEIMERERAAAKKERKARGEADPLGDDSSDDEDWEEEKQEPLEELSVSGSDDEGASQEDSSDASGEEEEETGDADIVAVDGQEDETSNPLLDNEADESDKSEAENEVPNSHEAPELDPMDEEDEEEDLPIVRKQQRLRQTNVISDDEDDSMAMETPRPPQHISLQTTFTDSPVAPTSVLRSATKTFIPGLSVSGAAGLGLTQIFAGTMGDTEDDFEEASPAASNSLPGGGQESMAFLKRFQAPDLPPFEPTMPEDSQDLVTDSQIAAGHVPQSQADETQTQGFQLHLSQSQVHGFDSLVDPLATQFSEYPEATQDMGFQHMTPILNRFQAPPSTIDTVLLDTTVAPEPVDETPIVKKRGKLMRRAPIVASFSDDEDDTEVAELAAQDEELADVADAFSVMSKASKKKTAAVDEFDRKKSKAKELINEQAEESEDEYAGLGGASDDESGGEEDEYVKEIIDDKGGVHIDESKLAAFFADRERASDEKQVEKLYNDITKGMLRRKRGADYDLSDSDDDGEARRRMKQKEFAKMRKALLADERIGKIAENPKRQAFLRAIEDRGSGDEMDFLDDVLEGEETESQSQSQAQGDESQQRVPDSQPDTSMGPPKRKRSDDATEAEARLPPHLRRTKFGKRPSSLSDIRDSLSSLIEEPNAVVAETQLSDSEDDLEVEGGPDKNKENRDPFALRRTNVSVIDRISLKRASSSSLSANTKLAFAASSNTPGFKIPPLLRKATTNNSIGSESSSRSSSISGMSTTERMAGGASDGIRRGGGKNSGVNFQARESARNAAVEKTQKRREQKLFKGAANRRKAVGGLLGAGKFE